MEESIVLPYSIFITMLSFVILDIVGFKRLIKLFIVVYLVVVEIATWMWGSNLLLIGSISFWLFSIGYTCWALHKKYKFIGEDKSANDDDTMCEL